MGVFNGVRRTGSTRTDNAPPAIAAERRRAIEREIARLQMLWDEVQKKINGAAEMTEPERVLLQPFVIEGDRLQLMMAQLEKARAALPDAET